MAEENKLPDKTYLKASEIATFLNVDRGTFRKMTWDKKRDKPKDRSARLFQVLHLPGYAWPVFKRTQVLEALKKVEE
jgi:DNA-binding transcriptional regulator YiaG